MKKWEYIVETINYYKDDSILNELGQQGWELVSCNTSESSPYAILIFKRELAN
jgi:hypothetical protein